MWWKTHVLSLQSQYATSSYHIFKNKHNQTQSILRESPIISPNFCIFWRVNSNFYLLTTYFFKFIFQQTLYLFFITLKYYFFIHSLIFFYSLFNISLFFLYSMFLKFSTIIFFNGLFFIFYFFYFLFFNDNSCGGVKPRPTIEA